MPSPRMTVVTRRRAIMRALFVLPFALVFTLASASAVSAEARRAGGERLGKVHFATSCAAPVAEEFDHAMALLHSFEFADAITGFKKALEGDPSCGIAQWGIAMSTWGNPFAGLRSPKTLQDGLAAAQTAQTIGARSDREREYIAAVALLYKDADTLEHRARTVAYEKAMERIYTKYPTDLEAAAFYALAVDQTALPTDKTYANQLKAAAILEKLYTVEPDHPGVTHYLIHSYDVSALAPRALPYARKYANLAPDAPHALHMPAHTFTRVGSWQESIDTNIRSHDVAMQRHDPGEALHAGDYEMYAYLQTAQDAAAKKILDGVNEIIARPAAQGWAFWAEGRKEDALRTLTAAAALEDTTDKSAITPGPIAPAHELLGEMLLEANQPAAALKEFETNLKREPNRFRSVYGAGRAAESAGDRAKARSYYGQLVKICERGDRRARPDLDHARQYVGASTSSERPLASNSNPFSVSPLRARGRAS